MQATASFEFVVSTGLSQHSAESRQSAADERRSTVARTSENQLFYWEVKVLTPDT